MRDETTAKQDRTDEVNANVPWRVIDVRVLAGYALAVRFADGTQGEVDLAPDAMYDAIRARGRWTVT